MCAQVLIPVGDAVNHASAHRTLSYSFSSFAEPPRALVFYATSDITPGAALTISYGDKSPAKLLLDYGFTEGEPGRYDEAPVRLYGDEYHLRPPTAATRRDIDEVGLVLAARRGAHELLARAARDAGPGAHRSDAAQGAVAEEIEAALEGAAKAWPSAEECDRRLAAPRDRWDRDVYNLYRGYHRVVDEWRSLLRSDAARRPAPATPTRVRIVVAEGIEGITLGWRDGDGINDLGPLPDEGARDVELALGATVLVLRRGVVVWTRTITGAESTLLTVWKPSSGSGAPILISAQVSNLPFRRADLPDRRGRPGSLGRPRWPILPRHRHDRPRGSSLRRELRRR